MRSSSLVATSLMGALVFTGAPAPAAADATARAPFVLRVNGVGQASPAPALPRRRTADQRCPFPDGCNQNGDRKGALSGLAITAIVLGTGALIYLLWPKKPAVRTNAEGESKSTPTPPSGVSAPTGAALATPFPMTTSRPPGVTYTPPSTPTPKPPGGGAPGTTSRDGGPGTDTRPTPAPSPSPSPTPTASPSPPPTLPPPTPPPTPKPSPTPTPCSVKVTDGWFEAIQGNYQDDPKFRPNPAHLVRQDGDVPYYFGQLDMIQGRPSVLIGVDRYYKNGNPVDVNSRDDIVIKGESTCSRSDDVKLRFTVYEHGRGPRVIYTSEVTGRVKLNGPPYADGKPRHWEVKLHAPKGVPDIRPFFFEGAADFYSIKAEVIRASGGDTDLKMWLDGYTEQTYGPQIRIIPVLLAKSKNPRGGAERSRILVEEANRLRQELYDRVPDLYPLKPYGLPMPRVNPVLDLTDKKIVDKDFDWTNGPDYSLSIAQEQKLSAALADIVAVQSGLEGASRNVALLTPLDYRLIETDDSSSSTVSTKLIVSKFDRTWTTIAHEIAHTLPQFLWSSDQMVAECGHDYHNESGEWGYGVQLYLLNTNGVRFVRDGTLPSLMQPRADYKYITQCTYHNLIGALKFQVDPPVVLIHGYIARKNGVEAAHFKPFYTFDGVVDRLPKGSPPYHLIARSEDGTIVRDVPFRPDFRRENGGFNSLVAFAVHTDPMPPQARTLELVTPRGKTLAKHTFSQQAPKVALDAVDVAADGKSARVRFHASGDGKLLFTVLTAPNVRSPFSVQRFEERATSATVPLVGAARGQRVRVIVTDGSRSASVDRTL